MRTRMCAYQGVRNVRFSENLGCFVFLKHPIVSSRVSASPKNINLTPFCLGQIFCNPPPPPFHEQPPFKILENLTPPLKCTFVQKSKDSFFKETKDFISKIK